jgi:hypothetical protein
MPNGNEICILIIAKENDKRIWDYGPLVLLAPQCPRRAAAVRRALSGGVGPPAAPTAARPGTRRPVAAGPAEPPGVSVACRPAAPACHRGQRPPRRRRPSVAAAGRDSARRDGGPGPPAPATGLTGRAVGLAA